MKKILILALLFIQCGENTVSRSCKCQMTISDALPIQFWLTDCDTYNERSNCGINTDCWCHPWECNDEIKIQFTDLPGIPGYYLDIIDSDDNEVDSVDFTESTIDSDRSVYALSFIPSELSIPITNSVVSFKIKRSYNANALTNPSFNGSISPWREISTDGGDSWTWTAGQVNIFTSGGSKREYQDVYLEDAVYTLNVVWARSMISGTAILTVGLADVNGNILQNITPAVGTTNTSINGIIGGERVRRIIFRAGGSFFGDVSVSNLNVTTSASSDFTLAKSDCIDIKPSQTCTKSIEYSNHHDYAGLIYGELSPEISFNIRVPAIFFHERFPETDEAIELSNSQILNLNSTIKAQKLLDTDFMPYYMHRKLKLILKHQFITIDNQDWIKEESYDIVEGNRMFARKKARCFLTQSNFLQRNVI